MVEIEPDQNKQFLNRTLTSLVAVIMSLEIEERLKKFLTYPGVKATIVINHEGLPIKTSLTDNGIAVQYAALVSRLTEKIRAVIKEMDASNEFRWIRIRTVKEEIVVAPEKEFIVVMVQEAVDWGRNLKLFCEASVT